MFPASIFNFTNDITYYFKRRKNKKLTRISRKLQKRVPRERKRERKRKKERERERKREIERKRERERER